jgi:hypothetical protein
MKKHINVIHIRGIKGIILACLTTCCLFAGFVVFPGFIAMHLWNYSVSFFNNIPTIGIIQGTLLWMILATLYMIIKKNSVVICFKAPEGLSEEELKTVFEDIKKQSREDVIFQAMMNARQSELKLKEDKKNKEEETSDLTK